MKTIDVLIDLSGHTAQSSTVIIDLSHSSQLVGLFGSTF